MAGDPTYEEMVAVVVDSDGVVPRSVGRDRRRDVARFVLGVDQLHHIVELRIVLKH